MHEARRSFQLSRIRDLRPYGVGWLGADTAVLSSDPLARVLAQSPDLRDRALLEVVQQDQVRLITWSDGSFPTETVVPCHAPRSRAVRHLGHDAAANRLADQEVQM